MVLKYFPILCVVLQSGIPSTGRNHVLDQKKQEAFSYDSKFSDVDRMIDKASVGAAMIER